MSQQLIVITRNTNVTRVRVAGEDFTLARLADDGERVLCGFHACDGLLGRIRVNGSLRELLMPVGWKYNGTTAGGLPIWRLTGHSEKRVKRGQRPRQRAAYISSALKRTAEKEGRPTDHIPIKEREDFEDDACVAICPVPDCWRRNYLDPGTLDFVDKCGRIAGFLALPDLEDYMRESLLQLREQLGCGGTP